MSDIGNEKFDGPLLKSLPLEPPGDWKRAEWVGLERWRSLHGPAVVCWDMGRISRVYQARLDDGSRMEIFGPRVGSVTSRIPRPDGDGFTHGLLVVYEDDVEFLRLALNPRLPPRPDVRPAFERLRDTPEFMAFLKTGPVHAYAVYTALQNRKITLPDGTLVQFGQRNLAGMIASMRDNGEDYLDYFVDDQHYEACLEFLPDLENMFKRQGFKISEP